jgi:hypothetical protein
LVCITKHDIRKTHLILRRERITITNDKVGAISQFDIPIGATITAHHKWRILHYTQWLLRHGILSIGYHYGLYVIEMSHAYHIFSLQRAAPTLFSNIAYRKSRKQR